MVILSTCITVRLAERVKNKMTETELGIRVNLNKKSTIQQVIYLLLALPFGTSIYYRILIITSHFAKRSKRALTTSSAIAK